MVLRGGEVVVECWLIPFWLYGYSARESDIPMFVQQYIKLEVKQLVA